MQVKNFVCALDHLLLAHLDRVRSQRVEVVSHYVMSLSVSYEIVCAWIRLLGSSKSHTAVGSRSGFYILTYPLFCECLICYFKCGVSRVMLDSDQFRSRVVVRKHIIMPLFLLVFDLEISSDNFLS